MNTWPDGTPKSQNNAFTLWKTGGESVMFADRNGKLFSANASKAREEGKISDLVSRTIEKRMFTTYSKAKAAQKL